MSAGNSPIKKKGVRPRVALDLQIVARAGKSHVRYLRAHLPQAHALLRSNLRELSIGMVDDAEMSELHARYLQISGPTDVLTFEIDHDSAGRPVSGEVIICVPEARRRAGRSRSRIQRELLLYALHGMLHLAGFDDRTPLDYRKMHRKEDEILIQLGVGAVFSPMGPSIHARTAGER